MNLKKACQTVFDVTKRPTVSYQNCIKNQPKNGAEEEQQQLNPEDNHHTHGATRVQAFMGGRANDE